MGRAHGNISHIINFCICVFDHAAKVLDATIVLDFMLGRFTGMMDKLIVYPDKMLSNLNMTKGVIFSQMVLF